MSKDAYEKFIYFFKKHGLYDYKMFKYLSENTLPYDFLEEEKRSSTGYHYILNSRKRLEEIKLIVPFIEDEKTIAINIHEYIHAITLYQRLGKKYKQDIDSEILPMLYEKIYLSENPSKELEYFLNYLDSSITKDSPLQYQLALEVQNQLLEYYKNIHPSFYMLQAKAKTITKKYKSR